jgi:protease PrsW
MSDLFRATLGLAPVLIFLLALIALDSYRLTKFSDVVQALLIGAGVAALCYMVNRELYSHLEIELRTFSRYVGPIVEETLKATYLVYLIRARRVGFLVDAAILGFAIGAGFAFVENLYFLRAAMSASLLTWVVRGLGTAVMHGGTVAILAILSKSTADRFGSERLILFAPGLTLVIVVHGLFNAFILPPVASTVLLLIVFPVLIFVVFQRSESLTRNWLGTGLDSDVELLDLIISGRISDSPIGRYLENLRSRFPYETVVDILCLLRLRVELSARAKGLLMMREAGLDLPPDPELEERFAEVRFLERSVGPTGQLAMLPFLRTSSRDLWQIYMLARLSNESPNTKPDSSQ